MSSPKNGSRCNRRRADDAGTQMRFDPKAKRLGPHSNGSKPSWRDCVCAWMAHRLIARAERLAARAWRLKIKADALLDLGGAEGA